MILYNLLDILMQPLQQISRLINLSLVMSSLSPVVLAKSKLQPTVATSSTEAEFVATVRAAMVAKYLCLILL
jgi:hypothetical protein